ncbi:MAG: class I SAM-dependent methyltransferase [Ferruginibacter sp.]
MKTILCILLSLSLLPSHSQPAQSRRQYYDSLMIENHRIQFSFLNLSGTDTVADIGTGAGYSLVPIASHFSGTRFVVEDIDSNYTSIPLLLKTAKKTGYNIEPENFTVHIGSELSTTLPAGAFNKVLAFDVIHEMTYRNEMLQDIKRILAKNGRLFIGEILVYKKRRKEKSCHYPFLKEDELKELLAANGFTILREQVSFEHAVKHKYFKLFECRVNE